MIKADDGASQQKQKHLNKNKSISTTIEASQQKQKLLNKQATQEHLNRSQRGQAMMDYQVSKIDKQKLGIYKSATLVSMP